MHQGPAGHLPPKGQQLCPRMQTPGGGVWTSTPPCGKTPPGPALHLNGRRDRRQLAGRARAQGAPADLPRLDRCSTAGHPEGLQAEGARPRRICRDTAKESRPAGRTPGPPPRATSTPDRASAAPLPAPEGLQADTAGRLDLSAAVEAGPDAASTPAAPRPPASSRAQLDTSTRGALPPADLGKWTHKRLRARARTRARSAGTDGASPPSWTPQRPGRSSRNSVGRRQPAPPLDTGSRAPAGHLNADSWRGTKKAPNPQKWCVIWCVKTLTC